MYFLGLLVVRGVGGVPGVRQHSSGPSEGFGGDGEGEYQHLQCVVHVFLGRLSHGSEFDKAIISLSINANVLPILASSDLHEQRLS